MLVFSDTGGTDPGLKLSKPVLHQTVHPNGCIKEAICIGYDPSISEVKWTTEADLSHFQESQNASWTFEGKTNVHLAQAAGGYGKAFAQAAREFRSTGSVFVSERNLTTAGEITYKIHQNVRLTEDFLFAVCALPVNYSEVDYHAFVREWGTHVVTSVRFGLRVVRRRVVSKPQFFDAVVQKQRYFHAMRFCKSKQPPKKTHISGSQ